LFPPQLEKRIAEATVIVKKKFFFIGTED